MNTTVRYISISHETASVAQRERFFIPDSEKRQLISQIRQTYQDIRGLLLLVTCNRTELYFESDTTAAKDLRDFFVDLKPASGSDARKHFQMSDKTEPTVLHLLNVSSGLASQVMGDAEIVCQIKKAFQFSMELKLQGSLLERAMQTVFKTHKRISNETQFRDGTTSTAYKSLKVVSETFTGDPTPKKILLIGTGDIVRQLLKYNAKFNFKNLYLSNRTREKAVALGSKYGCQVYEWEKVKENAFEDFDVIISAAGNCHHLIKNIAPTGKKRLLIDLALPGNIDRSLAKDQNITFFDLDAIAAELEETKDKRVSAISSVQRIIEEELTAYAHWYREAPFRALLAGYKIVLNKKVTQYLASKSEPYDEEAIATVTDRVMRKLIKQPHIEKPADVLDGYIKEHAVNK